MSEATSKLELIMGSEAVARLSSACVMVLGLGGVGSNCTEALARGGVGSFVLVDHDIVQESNINRQAIAFMSTLGQKKTDVMAKMIADINPNAQVVTLDKFVLQENVDELMDEWAPRVDYVVDAIDTISTKLALAQYADKNNVSLIASMGAANKLYPECFHVADIYETKNCPLCRIMRKEGRKRGISKLKVLYSAEEPVAVEVRKDATRRERSNLGTASYVPPIMGQMIAGEVLRDVAFGAKGIKHEI
ncbi:tRNA threonylcarbamoyladenosine dehydratase [Eggerthellaceae bacterium 3-80]